MHWCTLEGSAHCAAEAESLERDTKAANANVKSVDKAGLAADSKHDDEVISSAAGGDRDWAEIPVGIPFTEMVAKSRNFTEKRLKTETQSVRHTDMQPQQVRPLARCAWLRCLHNLNFAARHLCSVRCHFVCHVRSGCKLPSGQLTTLRHADGHAVL